MMLIYISPQGGKYLFPEGEQPEGYVLCEVQAKGYVPANKSRKAPTKRASSRKKG